MSEDSNTEDVEEAAVPDVDLCAVGEQDVPKGKLLWVTVDTGAGKSVTSKATAEGYKVRPSAGSRCGQKFIGPGDERYPNRGEVTLKFATEEDKPIKGDFQVADGLTKTLAAVSDSCDKGNIGFFDNEGSYLVRRDSPEGREMIRLAALAKDKVKLYRKNGTYLLPLWLQDGGESAVEEGFTRQGAKK